VFRQTNHGDGLAAVALSIPEALPPNSTTANITTQEIYHIPDFCLFSILATSQFSTHLAIPSNIALATSLLCAP
jgi:hypothetical protein